jgi:Ni,Fe-hydrogenase I cytochrome b subunit
MMEPTGLRLRSVLWIRPFGPSILRLRSGRSGRSGLRNFVKTSRFIMGVWRQLQEYLYIKKRDPNAPHSRWMQYMHGINRISLFMFIIAIIVIIVKLVMMKR